MYPPASGQKYAPVRFRLIALLLAVSLLALSIPQGLIRIIPAAEAASPDVVISQVYGGGGNSGATYKNDFIELFNRGTSAVTVTGWSVQYASNTGSSWQKTDLTGTIQPGQYYLVQQAAGAGGTTSLPTPNATGSISMSATAGKVALVTNTTPLACGATNNCSSSSIKDFVGFGSTATAYEGSGPSPAPSNTTAAIRANGGCKDDDNNAADFSTAAPTPRNSSSPTNSCPVANNPPAISAPANPAATVAQDSAPFTVGLTGSDDNNVFNWSAVAGAGVSSVSVTGGQGTASVTYTVTLQAGFSGTASFTARLSDNVNPAVTRTVNIQVNPAVVNNPPAIAAPANPAATVAQDAAPFTVNLNGSDDNNVFNWSAAAGTGVSAVSVTAGQGTPTAAFTVTLQAGFSGTASFTARLSDNVNPQVTQPVNITVTPAPLDHIVISQIYGGGGNSGATYTHDYVELYNPTTATVRLNNWSIQYSSATGTTWTLKQPIGGTIAPGEYYLVRLATGGANGSPLPVDANITGDINLSGTTGKVALVSNSDSLTGGACPVGSDPDLVDLVGYGTNANCREGSANAPAPSSSTSLYRKSGGSVDTNQNGADFVTGGPLPRRTAPIVELGPWVASTDPGNNFTNIPHDGTVAVGFSEPVDAVGAWYSIVCSATGAHNDATVAHTADFKTYAVTPNANFQFGEQCTVTVNKDAVRDRDSDDGAPDTDTLFDDHVWSFTVVAAGAPAPYPPAVHLTMGNPSDAAADVTQPDNYLMEKAAFTLSYNRDKGMPNWVSWHLDNSWYGTLARNDTFRADPAVPADWYRVQSTDYFGSGFDRGHMTPNADRDHQDSMPLNQATFLMTNIIPQAPDNNQGPWANLESYLRTLTDSGANEVYIVAGPAGVGGAGSAGPATTIAGGRITVPAKTWKVALVIPKGEDDAARTTAAARTIAVIMPNTQGIRTTNTNDWQSYLTSVDEVEALTGYDFFENLPDAVENSVEAGVNGNNPPGTEDGSFTTAEDVPAMVSMMAVGASSTLTYTVLSQPSNGTLSGTGANRVYTPAPGFSGTDSFTFRVSDGTRDSNTSTVTILVTDFNDAPAAGDDAKTTQEDTPLTFAAGELAANDNAGAPEESAQTLTVNAVNGGADTHGAVALSNGQVTYTPDANYHGPAAFTYTVCDDGTTTGSPDSKCATANVNVTVTPVNDAPAPADDSAATDEDTPASINVRANDTDVDGDAVSVSSVTQGAHGAVSDNGDGTLTYTPAANYHGADAFTYTVSDGHGGTAAATVNVTVSPVNDGPVANADAAATDEDTPVSVDVRANDADVDGDNLTVSAVTQGAHGAAAITDNGAGVTYTPAPDYVGADSFTYTVSDGHGGTSTASVSVTVRDTTAPALAVPGGITAEAMSASGAIVTYTVSASDNSGAAPAVQCSAASGALYPLGTTTVNCQATDGSGNMSPVRSFQVSVADTTAPALSLPATIIADATSAAGAEVSFAPTASDAVSGAPPVTCAPTSGGLFAAGQTTVNCSATDAAGNTSAGSFLIYVNPFGTTQEAAPVGPSQDAPPVPLTVETATGQSLDLSLDFGAVSQPGVVTVEPIADPAQIGQIPEGFAVSNLVAFQINTTAVFEADAAQGKGVVVGFVVPPIDGDGNGVDDITPEAFGLLAVLHNNNGVIESLEIVSRDYASRTISAKTYSFSPFYLARRVTNKIATLFDRAQAYKSGSTVPVKVKLLDANSGQNLSSSSTPLVARGIRLSGSPTALSVQDAGQANADYNFRFVGATDGGSYIYNLSTKGYAPGHYVLSIYVGNDRSFFHTISFDVR